MKAIKSITISMLILLAITSCSSVFSGGFTGKIMEDKGGLDDSANTPLAGATVFIYTDEGTRNSDYDRAISNGTKPSNATATTTTNDNGQFSVSKIIWKTNNPSFGKTADKINLYLIIYKSGFGVNGFNKNSNAISITSDSTNESTYTESFKRTEKVSTITFNLTNVANNGETINDTLLVKLTDLEAINCNISKTSSSNTFSVSYKNDDNTQPKIKINSYTIQSENEKSTWIKCDDNGGSFNPIEKYIQTAADSQSIDLYAKQTKFSYPTITGRLANPTNSSTDGNIGTSADDGIVIEYYVGEKSIGRATTTTSQIANDRVKHGVFTITPNSSEKWTIPSYEGKYAPIPTIILKKSGASPKEIRGYTTQSNTIDVGDITIP
ncbi:hypothetical protein [Bullifex porci]|uniref:hypothetical protein n=1 Tax=Bullifex porci TaxID=2606638 RepID=UPI0023F44D43|nr:hypothetical protein [Bullifex porci]MDD7255004.1 hypothetical protein [Bullifex porci]MDY2740609.1 hypothetical protein [Bullifex porci]